ncbi:hypothetical protein KEM54_002687, partial [Ascosphaera aggregata]
MPHTPLTSHHMNYLIWSFEGYGEAAILLQRHWMPDPQSLPFAPLVRTHALVSLVQKGLQYWELEKSISKDGKVVRISPETSFWGPPVEGISTTGQFPGNCRRSATSLKQTVESNGNVDSSTPVRQAAKAVESVEEVENVADATAEVQEEMAVDEDGAVDMTNQAENMVAQEVFTLAAGQSTGVQIAPAKAVDLAPQTTMLEIPETNGPILKTAWRPQDSTTLAVCGNDSCGLYRSPAGRWSESSATYRSLIEAHEEKPAAVTAMAWNADGTLLAVATYTRLMGTITLYGPTGEVCDTLPDTPLMVSSFIWAPHGLRLIVVMSDPSKSQVALWDQALKAKEFSRIHQVDGHIYDVAWPDADDVFALADKSMYKFTTADDVLQVSRVYSTEEKRDSWSLLCATTVSGESVAIAASTQDAKLYVPTHDIIINQAHTAAILSIQACAMSSPETAEDPRNVLLTTASMDGTLKLWRVDLKSKVPTCLHQLSFTTSPVVLASSISPDTYAVAGASLNQLS